MSARALSARTCDASRNPPALDPYWQKSVSIHGRADRQRHGVQRRRAPSTRPTCPGEEHLDPLPRASATRAQAELRDARSSRLDCAISQSNTRI